VSYNSSKAQDWLDAWADRAVAEFEAMAGVNLTEILSQIDALSETQRWDGGFGSTGT
jgi:dUTPase